MSRTRLTLLSIALAVGVLVSLSFTVGLWNGFETSLEDHLFSAKPVDRRIVILAIDDASLAKIGQWPWPRATFARALEKLNAIKPVAVGIDVLFADSSRLGAWDDEKLAMALRKVTFPVVLPVEASPLIAEKNSYRAGILTSTLPLFVTKNVTLGHVNLILDNDTTARRLPLVVNSGEKKFNSLSEEVAIRIGVNISHEASTARIVYAGSSGAIRRISFYRLLDEDLTDDLRGKIVLLGATAADLHDEKATPVSGGTEMPGVEIQANVINMFLRGYSLVPLSLPLLLGWIFLATLLPALIFDRFKKAIALVSLNVLLGIGYIVAVILLFEHGVSANLTHITLSWVLSSCALFTYRYTTTGRERRQLEEVFSKYVSRSVLDQILQDPRQVKLGGEEREVTVFFSDIRGFTTLSEKIPPQELVRILNRYFTVMTAHVLENGGVVDKFIGDAIMAFWGAPIDDPDQADRAVKTALAMRMSLSKLNEELRTAGDPEIRIGVGIFTGKAVVGNVGSSDRFDYTVMGDTVNVASRLEGLNKEYKTDIIVGQTTKDKVRASVNFKSLGTANVKGRAEAISIYTVE